MLEIRWACLPIQQNQVLDHKFQIRCHTDRKLFKVIHDIGDRMGRSYWCGIAEDSTSIEFMTRYPSATARTAS